MATTDLSLVTLSLRNLLDANVRRLMGGAMPSELTITTMPPEDVTASTVTLNLHLYAVMEDPHFKNAVGLRREPHPVAGEPMALRLYYVLTPHLTNAEVFDAEGQQRAMGRAMKTFHDFPVITDELQITPTSAEGPVTVMEPGLSGGDNRIEISLRPLEPEETINFWSAEERRTARLSAFYEVRTVLLEPEPQNGATGAVFDLGLYVKTASAARITGSRAVLPFSMPAATGLGEQSIGVTPARATLRAAATADRPIVRVIGRNLTSGDAREVTIRAFAWAEARMIDPALNLDWALEVRDDEICFIPQATLEVDDGAGGTDTIAIAPGGHEIGMRLVSYRYQGTARLETISDPGRAIVGFAPHIDQVTGPDGDGRFHIEVDPVVDLTAATTITLAVGGEIMARTGSLPAPPAGEGRYEVNAAEIVFAPLFDATIPAAYPIRLVVDGVEAQPFWVEV